MTSRTRSASEPIPRESSNLCGKVEVLNSRNKRAGTFGSHTVKAVGVQQNGLDRSVVGLAELSHHTAEGSSEKGTHLVNTGSLDNLSSAYQAFGANGHQQHETLLDNHEIKTVVTSADRKCSVINLRQVGLSQQNSADEPVLTEQPVSNPACFDPVKDDTSTDRTSESDSHPHTEFPQSISSGNIESVPAAPEKAPTQKQSATNVDDLIALENSTDLGSSSSSTDNEVELIARKAGYEQTFYHEDPSKKGSLKERTFDRGVDAKHLPVIEEEVGRTPSSEVEQLTPFNSAIKDAIQKLKPAKAPHLLEINGEEAFTNALEKYGSREHKKRHVLQAHVEQHDKAAVRREKKQLNDHIEINPEKEAEIEDKYRQIRSRSRVVANASVWKKRGGAETMFSNASHLWQGHHDKRVLDEIKKKECSDRAAEETKDKKTGYEAHIVEGEMRLEQALSATEYHKELPKSGARLGIDSIVRPLLSEGLALGGAEITGSGLLLIEDVVGIVTGAAELYSAVHGKREGDKAIAEVGALERELSGAQSVLKSAGKFARALSQLDSDKVRTEEAIKRGILSSEEHLVDSSSPESIQPFIDGLFGELLKRNDVTSLDLRFLGGILEEFLPERVREQCREELSYLLTGKDKKIREKIVKAESEDRAASIKKVEGTRPSETDEVKAEETQPIKGRGKGKRRWAELKDHLLESDARATMRFDFKAEGKNTGDYLDCASEVRRNKLDALAKSARLEAAHIATAKKQLDSVISGTIGDKRATALKFVCSAIKKSVSNLSDEELKEHQLNSASASEKARDHIKLTVGDVDKYAKLTSKRLQVTAGKYGASKEVAYALRKTLDDRINTAVVLIVRQGFGAVHDGVGITAGAATVASALGTVGAAEIAANAVAVSAAAGSLLFPLAAAVSTCMAIKHSKDAAEATGKKKVAENLEKLTSAAKEQGEFATDDPELALIAKKIATTQKRRIAWKAVSAVGSIVNAIGFVGVAVAAIAGTVGLAVGSVSVVALTVAAVANPVGWGILGFGTLCLLGAGGVKFFLWVGKRIRKHRLKKVILTNDAKRSAKYRAKNLRRLEENRDWRETINLARHLTEEELNSADDGGRRLRKILNESNVDSYKLYDRGLSDAEKEGFFKDPEGEFFRDPEYVSMARNPAKGSAAIAAVVAAEIETETEATDAETTYATYTKPELGHLEKLRKEVRDEYLKEKKLSEAKEKAAIEKRAKEAQAQEIREIQDGMMLPESDPFPPANQRVSDDSRGFEESRVFKQQVRVDVEPDYMGIPQPGELEGAAIDDDRPIALNSVINGDSSDGISIASDGTSITSGDSNDGLENGYDILSFDENGHDQLEQLETESIKEDYVDIDYDNDKVKALSSAEEVERTLQMLIIKDAVYQSVKESSDFSLRLLLGKFKAEVEGVPYEHWHLSPTGAFISQFFEDPKQLAMLLLLDETAVVKILAKKLNMQL